jgi:hypothetical protein
MTKKEIRTILTEFQGKSPGYILNLSRRQFEELVEDTLDIEISEQTESNANRFKSLLTAHSADEVEDLLVALRAI